MATSSFDRHFYVDSNNIDEFMRTLNAHPITESNGFSSKAVSGEELKQYINSVMDNTK